ncbi:potassium-transporting ATPase subunit KdpA [Chitinophagaceae bacterium MMS25-I14]
MNTEIISIIFTYALTLGIALLLARYIAKVFAGEKVWTDHLFGPVERFLYRFSGINPAEEMNWKQHLKALLTINMLWLVYAFFVLLFQDKLPLNPDGNPAQTPDLAFNSAISFLVNCNLQDYSGETGATYFSQLFVFMFLHFVSAATGIAAMAALFKGLREKTTTQLGNFWVFFLRSITRILLPVSVVIATILVFNGTPASYKGKDTIITMQGDTMHVSRGPAAGMIAIKHLGTNGGGWFGANSAHPLENPNYLTNMTEVIAQVILPVALIFAMGIYIRRKRFAYIVFGVMTAGMLLLMVPTIVAEMHGNPAIAHMGISTANTAMEGKEVRFGIPASAYWSTVTTIISTGSVNCMHESMMPMTGAMQLIAMMVNCFYGGCGVGILNYYIFIIIAVFISGLMVGRTPEFMGHKVEAKEMKIAAVIALLHPLLILAGTALSSYIYVHHSDAAWAVQPKNWLNNPGFHGFSEMLYQYSSSSANNGSGFEGLSDNNPFWNISTGFVLILSRFLPIIGPLAIVGIMAQKKYIPESAGTLKTDTPTFGFMTMAVIMIIAALAFFPALALGPLAEYFSM